MDACVPQTESSAAACTNGRDDDCDGTTDCRDLGCAVFCVPDAGPDVACVPRGTEDSNAACSNGVDDDCDGFIDCGGATPPDFGCTMSAAVTVCPRDGGVTPDVACTPTGPENAVGACGDRIDNDCDGYTDCVDRDCSCVGTCAAFRAGCTCGGAENTTASCRDAVDNDCDGFIDCNDFGCSTNPAITFCPRDAGRD
jgi:hypothetical protein